MTSQTGSDLPFLDLFGAEFQTNPYGELERLRAQHWCAMTPIGLALLRYADVQALVASRQFRTPAADLLAMQGFTEGLMVDAMRSFLLNTEGAAHDRVRRLVSRAFTTRAVEAFRPRMRAIADELVDEMLRHESCDVIESFCMPYSWRVLCEFVGIPASAQGQVQQWNIDIGYMFGLSAANYVDVVETALLSLYAFIDELVAQVRQAPGDDLLSALVTAEESGDQLSTGELRAMIITLMSAGSGTTAYQLGNALATFLDHPEQWRLLAKQPELMPQAVEEIMRFRPTFVLGLPRIAIEATSINGIELQPGACVVPMTASANRDAAIFDDAEAFNIGRAPRSQQGQITFGGGIHYCLGATMARAELNEALSVLSSRLGELAAAAPAEWRAPTEVVVGPARLPIRYAGTARD